MKTGVGFAYGFVLVRGWAMSRGSWYRVCVSVPVRECWSLCHKTVIFLWCFCPQFCEGLDLLLFVVLGRW